MYGSPQINFLSWNNSGHIYANSGEPITSPSNIQDSMLYIYIRSGIISLYYHILLKNKVIDQPPGLTYCDNAYQSHHRLRKVIRIDAVFLNGQNYFVI